jgi:DNA-binding protein YbaB
MSGIQECLQVSIAPELLIEAEVERLEGLLLLAVNQAIKDSQLMAARRLSPFTDQLDRPSSG